MNLCLKISGIGNGPDIEDIHPFSRLLGKCTPFITHMFGHSDLLPECNQVVLNPLLPRIIPNNCFYLEEFTQ